MSDEIDWDAVREYFKRLAIAALNQQMALPSPPPRQLSTLATGDTNAIFIDGTGKTREMRIADFRPEYQIQMPIPFNVRWRGPQERPELPCRFPVAVFRLSTVQDGKAVYRLSHTTR